MANPFSFIALFDQFGDEWIPPELIELVAYMQHVGTPTRMLDFTSEILTAVYFAAWGALQDGIVALQQGPEAWAIWKEKNMGIWELNRHGLDDAFKIVSPHNSGNQNAHMQQGKLLYNVIDGGVNYGYDDMLDNRPMDERVEQGIFIQYTLPVTECVNALEKISSLGTYSSKLFPEDKGRAVVQDVRDRRNITKFKYLQKEMEEMEF